MICNLLQFEMRGDFGDDYFGGNFGRDFSGDDIDLGVDFLAATSVTSVFLWYIV